MSRFDCREARRCLDDAVAGSLSEREREALDAHLAFCERCSEDVRLWSAAIGVARGAALEPRPAPVWDAASAVPQPARRPRRWGPALLAAVLSLTAIGALAAVLPRVWRGGAEPSVPEPEGESIPGPGASPIAIDAGDTAPHPVDSGAVEAPEPPLPSAEDRGAEDTGTSTAAPQGPGEIDEDAWTGDEPRLALRAAEPAPADPPGLDGLVLRAQGLRAEHEYSRACDVYREVIDRFPVSRASANARVALGQIELGAMDRPAVAIAYFDEYLEITPDGVLAEDARLGQVRAWAALDDPEEILAAGDEFLARHPRGISAAEVLRVRGDTLRQGGDCASAVVDYAAVLEGWADSPHAEWARVGLDTCGGY